MLTSVLYHFMIVAEKRICWKIFQCKRVMHEKYIYSLSCVVVIRFGLQKRQTVLKSSLLYAIHYNIQQ
jgi:hypothetical protein